MYLECVIVCVNYSDFLAHTLPYNKQHFDRMVVVTDTKDDATALLCESHYVECIRTDVFYENGDSFNKAKGINVGLSALSNKDWTLHLDADIFLPALTRSILERISLNKENLYGIDRSMCSSYREWQNFLSQPITHTGWCYVHPTPFKLGVRIAEYMSSGFEVIGFFQLFHSKGSGIYTYPVEHGAADRTDVLFCKLWERSKRVLIPEIIGIHLESEGLSINEQGLNWNGRKSVPFTYEFSVNQEINKIKEEMKQEIYTTQNNEDDMRGYNIPFWKKILYTIKHFLQKHHTLTFLIIMALLLLLMLLN